VKKEKIGGKFILLEELVRLLLKSYLKALLWFVLGGLFYAFLHQKNARFRARQRTSAP
jgi:hypothetical protein